MVGSLSFFQFARESHTHTKKDLEIRYEYFLLVPLIDLAARCYSEQNMPNLLRWNENPTPNIEEREESSSIFGGAAFWVGKRKGRGRRRRRETWVAIFSLDAFFSLQPTSPPSLFLQEKDLMKE